MTGISVPTLAIMSPSATGSMTFLISSPSFMRAHSRRLAVDLLELGVPGSISR